MNKKIRKALFAAGTAAFVGFVVLFGYLAFTGEKICDRISLGYTDRIRISDGKTEATGSGVTFRNESATKCRMNIRWGDESEEYSFLTLVKITEPDGGVAAYVTGDNADQELVFDLKETGIYTISSEYYTDAYAFQDAVWQMDKSAEKIQIDNGNTFDGFVFTGADCDTSQTFEIRIITLR